MPCGGCSHCTFGRADCRSYYDRHRQVALDSVGHCIRSQLIVTRAVIEAAAGGKSVMQSMKTSISTMAHHPVRMLRGRPFGLMMLLYSGTYLTANVIDTISSQRGKLPLSTTTSTATKLGTITTVNVALSLWKDSQFARVFGNVSSRSLPPVSYVPFVLRDGLTLFATFNLPPLLAPSVPYAIGSVDNRLALAQLVLPAAMQVLATPLHLLGLDFYNRDERCPWQDRMRRIKATWASATVARMWRIVPAYGLGGVVNTSMRKTLMDSIEGTTFNGALGKNPNQANPGVRSQGNSQAPTIDLRSGHHLSSTRLKSPTG